MNNVKLVIRLACDQWVVGVITSGSPDYNGPLVVVEGPIKSLCILNYSETKGTPVVKWGPLVSSCLLFTTQC